MDRSIVFIVSCCVSVGGLIIITYLLFSMDVTVEFAKMGGNAFMKAPVFTESARFVVNVEYNRVGFDR